MSEANKDVRWIQRFVSFNKAFSQLERFLDSDDLNEMEEQGLIKAFEYTYELSWKTLQDLLKEKGYPDVLGPKPVIEQSFRDGYITEGKAWMHMHQSRNLTSHTYDEKAADEIIESIRKIFFELFKSLKTRLEEERSGKQDFKMIDSVKYGLLESDIHNVVSIIQSNQHIHKAVLFGSRAKGTYHAGSDIDIALQGEDLKTDDIISILLEIDTLFLPYKFDLVIYNRITEKDLVDHIDRVGIVLFSK